MKVRALLAVARESSPPPESLPLEVASDEVDSAASDAAEAFYLEFCRAPVHRLVAASEQAPVPPVVFRVPRSVFDLAVVDVPPMPLAPPEELPRWNANAEPQRGAGDPGALRVVGCRYPVNRWTEARAEYEKRRRAKQRPPRPTKRARTTGKKLRDLIGPQFDDD